MLAQLLMRVEDRFKLVSLSSHLPVSCPHLSRALPAMLRTHAICDDEEVGQAGYGRGLRQLCPLSESSIERLIRGTLE